MARPEKEAAVQEIANIFEKAKGVFVTDYKGLNVEQMTEFRRQCRDADVDYVVVKNTLARIASQKVGVEDLIEHLKGPSAIAYSLEDPSAPARVISKFNKKTEKPKIRVSLFEGSFYGPDKVEAIAALPSKEQLLAQVLGGCNAPIQGFVGSLNGILSKLVRTLDAVRESKQ